MANKNTDPFRDHVQDLLAPLGDVRIRAMFGGYGVYTGELMFALIDEDTLYFKVDASNEPAYLERGLEPFVYPSPRGPMAMAYRRAPDDGLDDGEVLRTWAEGAIAAAVRAKDAKKSGAKKGRAPKTNPPKKGATTAPAVKKNPVKKGAVKKRSPAKKSRGGR